MKRVGGTENVQDREDYNNSLCYFIGGRGRLYCPFYYLLRITFEVKKSFTLILGGFVRFFH